MRETESGSSVDLSWPHLHAPVSSPIRASIARRLFLDSVRHLPLSVVMPDGRSYGRGRDQYAHGGDPCIVITDPAAFFARIGRDGSLGFGESYLLGVWETAGRVRGADNLSDELAAWLTIYGEALRDKTSPLLRGLRRLWQARLPVAQRNSVDGAPGNVRAHYDLNSALFRVFLDDSLTYSSAWFDDAADDLAAAQTRKVDAILDLAGVTAGTRLLDVGSGFGYLGIRAALVRGAESTGLTLSQMQFDHCLRAVEAHGLGAKVEFRLEDYREHSGTYDSIVSVEMIEAVGADYWADYFSMIDRLLAPGGRVGLQVITFPHQRMLASKHDFSWVDRYIFPGGALPSLTEINRLLRARTSLEIVQARRLSDSYARTLKEWRHRFLRARSDVAGHGFDETFIRLWTLYFAYFEAGFRSRYCDVWQLGLARTPPTAMRSPPSSFTRPPGRR